MADHHLPSFELMSSSSRDRFEIIAQRLNSGTDTFFDVNEKLPGLAGLLDDIVNPEVTVTPEESIQRLMEIFFKSTDNSNELILDHYSAEEQKVIRAFAVEKKSAEELAKIFEPGVSVDAREKLPIIEPSANLRSTEVLENLHSDLEELKTSVDDALVEAQFKLPKISFPHRKATPKLYVSLYNDTGRKVQIDTWSNISFENWGRTVQNKPVLTFIPRTSYGIQEIVKYAKSKNLNVRASGYRHSWSPVFGKDGGIIISTLGLVQSTLLPNIESLPGSEYFVPKTELRSIDFLGPSVKDQKRLVRVGTAVTNQQFRRWCLDQKMEKASTLPMNVIMVEITLGGSNAPICHGAGRRHSTLSDLVYAIEYVDANGEMRTLSRKDDPKFMSLAGGCFGLLGIVTHITLELDPMTYAVMAPVKLPVMQAIPPPPDMKQQDIPKALWIERSPEQRKQDQAEFEKHARSDFYSEWFWFPYTSKVWVNCWDVTADPKGAREYPSKGEVVKQWLESVAFKFIAETSASLNLQKVIPYWQVTAISRFALEAMPDIKDPKDAIETPLPNAIHFRRAVQNTRVRDMEVEMPLQPKKGVLKDAKFDDEIDFTIVQRAFWDAILLAYRNMKDYPQRMPLEMRITGPSNVLMAPFRGHNLGTASIEILTLENMKKWWTPYAQECLDLWMSYKDNEGNYLMSRPHWAKEWHGLTVRGQPMKEYLKDQYKDAIVEFKQTYADIAKKQKWTVADARQRFGNETFEDIIWDNKPWKELAIQSATTSVAHSSKAGEVSSPAVSVIEIEL